MITSMLSHIQSSNIKLAGVALVFVSNSSILSTVCTQFPLFIFTIADAFVQAVRMHLTRLNIVCLILGGMLSIVYLLARHSYVYGTWSYLAPIAIDPLCLLPASFEFPGCAKCKLVGSSGAC